MHFRLRVSHECTVRMSGVDLMMLFWEAWVGVERQTAQLRGRAEVLETGGHGRARPEKAWRMPRKAVMMVTLLCTHVTGPPLAIDWCFAEPQSS
jgi:hypothetical protein